MMEKEMLGHTFKYENDKLYKWRKNHKKWNCCNDLKVHKSGYIHVYMNGRSMKLHRLVYYFHNPDWDIYDASRDNLIDHINEVKTDNRIENLRVVNHSQNLQNKTYYGAEKVKGVSYRTDNNSKRWRAHWKEQGVLKTKCFATEEEALAHRAEMVRLHYTHAPTQIEE